MGKKKKRSSKEAKIGDDAPDARDDGKASTEVKQDEVPPELSQVVQLRAKAKARPPLRTRNQIPTEATEVGAPTKDDTIGKRQTEPEDEADLEKAPGVRAKASARKKTRADHEGARKKSKDDKDKEKEKG